MLPRERRWRNFGKWFVTPCFAIGSGMITTVALSSLPILAGFALPWLIPILAVVFLAETIVSIYLFKQSVPDTLASLFVTNIFKGLSRFKKILLGVGLFSALGGGLSLAALTYISGTSAIGAILGLFSISFPPIGMAIGGLLAITGFIAVSGLFIKWISVAIQNDAHLQVKSFFKKIFTRNPSKPLAQQILEGGFKLFFTFSIILLTLVGTIATLGTMHKGLVQFLSLLPNANLLATNIAAGIISYALMGAARLPWAIQSVCTVFSKIGEGVGRAIFQAGCFIVNKKIIPAPSDPNKKEELPSRPNSRTILSSIAKISAVIIHGFSFGSLARTGGGHVVSELISNLKFPLSSSAIQATGQISSIVTGGAMAGGIAAFTLFKPKPILDAKQPSIVELDEVPSLRKKESKTK